MNMNRKIAFLFLTLSLGSSSLLVKSSEAAEVRYQPTARPSILVVNRNDHQVSNKFKNVQFNNNLKREVRHPNNVRNIYQKKRVLIAGHYQKNLKTLKRIWIPAHWEFR